MTSQIIDDILPYTQIIATGGQTVFDTDWTADVASDIVVYQRAALSVASDVADILPTNAYNVTFIGGGLIVRVTLLTPATAGDIVTITRQTPAERLNLYTNTNFTPSMLNNDFGILTLVDQQAQLVNQQRAPRYNYSDTIDQISDIILPRLGPGESWVMNGSGDMIIAAVAGGSGDNILAQLASHDPGEGASLIGLNPTGTVQDLADTTFIIQTASSAAPNAQVLGALTTGIVKNTAITGVLSISAPLTSIDGLTTAVDQMLYTTASNVYATTSLTPFMRTVLDDLTAAAAAVTLNVLPLTGALAMTGALDMGTHLIHNVVDPVSLQDAATKNYVDNVLTSGFLPLTGGTMLGAISMGNFKITNLANPTLAQDAVTLATLNTTVANYLPLAGGTMALNTGTINMNSSKITNLEDPTNAQDAATKAYVDLVAVGLTIQPAVYASTTADLAGYVYANGAAGIGATLTAGSNGAFSTDGTSPPLNSRIIVPFQSTTLENGIYVLSQVGDGSNPAILTRATDYDQPSEITAGDLVVVNNGTTYGGGSFIETVSVSAIGTDPILFSVFTFAPSTFLVKANNLSDVNNTVTSFNNISPTTTKGDLIVDDGTDDVRMPAGADFTLLQANSGATNGIQYTTATYPETTTINEILYSSAANTIVGLATNNGGVLVTNNTGVPSMLTNPAAVGRILQSANAAIPTWSASAYPASAGATAGKIPISDGTDFILSTSIWPNTVGAVGKIIRSDGTVNAYSTSTFADTYTLNDILYASSANTVVGLAKVNSAVLATDATGVPTYLGPLTNGQVVIGSTGAIPVAATLTAGSGVTITNAAGSITISSSSGGIAWSTIAGTTQAAAVDNGYIVGNAAQTTITLPATAPIGSTVRIVGKGAGGWILAANTGQTIRFNSTVTSTAGTLTSTNRYDNVEVVAITADTEWSVSFAGSTGLTVA